MTGMLRCIVLTIFLALVKGDELQDFEKTGEALRLNCLLVAGTPVSWGEGKYNCTNFNLTEEECSDKGGKFGKFCLDENRCAPVPGRCLVNLPTELITPVVQQFLERLFKRVKEVEGRILDMEYDDLLQNETTAKQLTPKDDNFKSMRKRRRRRRRRRM